MSRHPVGKRKVVLTEKFFKKYFRQIAKYRLSDERNKAIYLRE